MKRGEARRELHQVGRALGLDHDEAREACNAFMNEAIRLLKEKRERPKITFKPRWSNNELEVISNDLSSAVVKKKAQQFIKQNDRPGTWELKESSHNRWLFKKRPPKPKKKPSQSKGTKDYLALFMEKSPEEQAEFLERLQSAADNA